MKIVDAKISLAAEKITALQRTLNPRIKFLPIARHLRISTTTPCVAEATTSIFHGNRDARLSRRVVFDVDAEYCQGNGASI